MKSRIAVDAAVRWDNGKAYFFKGKRYVRYDLATNAAEYMPPIKKFWNGLPWTNIDAVVHKNGVAYFFKGGEYLVYSSIIDQVIGVPTPLSALWGEGVLPAEWEEGIDTGIVWPNGYAYFFLKDKYIKYDLEQMKVVGMPKLIKNFWGNGTWPSGWDNLDAAVLWNNGYAYFFRKSRYIRYNILTDIVDGPRMIRKYWPALHFSEDAFESAPGFSWRAYFFKNKKYARYDALTKQILPNYPKDIATYWPGLPDHVDAALTWYQGRYYFFNGASDAIRVRRYDMVKDGVDNGPYKIGTYWGNWPSSWKSIDAVVLWNNQRAYFFKGSEYLRYDVQKDQVLGSPKPILGNWSFPAGWENGIDAAFAWYDGTAYFFKGKRCIHVEMKTGDLLEEDDIDVMWPGWPPEWNGEAPDACVTWIEAPLSACKDVPHCYYKLPFGDDPEDWNVTKGNQDDPSNPHDANQQFALDLSCQGKAGKYIRAARGGIVYAVRADSAYMTADGGNPPGFDGEGGCRNNYVVILHVDGSFGVYYHMRRYGVFPLPGDRVVRGDVIGVTGQSGCASGPHLHFDVEYGWDAVTVPDYQGKEYLTMKVRYQDHNHNCWIPRVGDELESNNP